MTCYPHAYIQFLQHFHQTRDFFECHEVLEEYWKEHPDSPYKETWVGLIQVAVSLYHQRRGNRKGAQKMMQSALRMLGADELNELGIDAPVFLQRLRSRLTELHQDEAYADLDIPIADSALLAYVSPSTRSEVVSLDIIHKHTRRDRSEVIAARKREWLRRRSRQD